MNNNTVKECKQCGENFKSINERKKFCSDKCRSANHRQNAGTLVVVCKGCQKEFNTYNRKKVYCSNECKKINWCPESRVEKRKTFHDRQCKECGGHFVTSYTDNVFCARSCYNKYYNRLKEFKRRSQISDNGEINKEISINRLIKRDGFKCYLCNKDTNKNKDYNHDDYPSVDHVKPLTKGGTHTWDNVKLAHRKCNREKSDNIL